jgi:hypothetical protein
MIKKMDNYTKNALKAAAFDSYDDEMGYDDSFDDTYDSVDNYKGKKSVGAKPALMSSSWVATSGYFTVSVVNAIGAVQRIEIFSSLRNAAFTSNTTLYPTYLPFVFSNRAAANANNTVVFAANGDQIITNNAGAILTISCKQVPYRTLLESLKFYRISVRQTKIGYTNEPQLDNDITHVTQTLLGKLEQNTFTPRVYFKDTQFQSKQVTVTQPYIIDGERGLQVDVNSGETMSFNFYLDGIQKA